MDKGPTDQCAQRPGVARGSRIWWGGMGQSQKGGHGPSSLKVLLQSPDTKPSQCQHADEGF